MSGFEPVLIGALANIFIETFKKKGLPLLDRLDINLGNQAKIFEKAAEKYIQNYEERHGTLKVVCVRMDAPVNLESVYTGVRVLNRSDLKYFESTESLHNLHRESGKRGFEFRDSPKREGLDVVNREQFLMVLGGPGVGKSTFLRRMGLEALKLKQGKFLYESIPVFLELKRFNSQSVTITQFMAKEFETCGLLEPEKFTQYALEEGKLLVLLDGLDEVPTENLDFAITQIQDLIDRYSQNRYIASCRIAAYKGGVSNRFKDVTMAAFEDEQIKEFIGNWFKTEPEMGTNCWELLKQPTYAATKELAKTPLLLTLICGVYDENQDLPRHRAAVYGEALDVLLRKWGGEKRIRRDRIFQELTPVQEHTILTQIAYDSFSADRLFFSKAEIVEKIDKILAANLNSPKHLNGELILEAIAVQQGILVERARDAYSFSHLTLQEYLTAQYIVDHNFVENLVSDHLTDQRWQEVFLLIAELMRGGADTLLLEMETQAEQLINTPKLLGLLQWADRVTKCSEGQFNPVAKRVAVIYIAFAPDPELAINIDFAIDLTLELDLDLDDAFVLEHAVELVCEFDRAFDLSIDINDVFDRVLALALALEKIKIYDNVNFTELITRLETIKSIGSNSKVSFDERHVFAEEILQLWCDATHIDRDLLRLSESEEEALENYFYANLLMIQCKDAAVRVTPQVWQKIEEMMLIPPAQLSSSD